LFCERFSHIVFANIGSARFRTAYGPSPTNG
jgi:hypothetical protein